VTLPRDRRVRLCLALLRTAAPLTPADVRREWLEEWRAEVAWTVARESRRPDRRRWASLCLVLRCAGAFAHAGWLRWDRWRIEMLLQDVKYAVRTLVKKPGFAAIAILTLAVGIGGNAAIFSAVRAVLLRPLPFPSPDDLVEVFSTNAKSPLAMAGTASPPDFTDWRRENTSFTELAAINAGAFAMTGPGLPAEQITGAGVTGGFFDVLQVDPLYGRTLTPDDDATGGPLVAVLGHTLWQRRFGGDPHIVGRTVTIDADDYRIVGIMPRGFSYPLQAELWLPQRFTATELATQRGAHYLDVIGRLKPGVSSEQARQGLEALALRLADAYPDTNRDARIAVHGLRTAMVGSVRTPLYLLLGAVGFVLLIVCVNMANLVVTRALGRARELAIRTALGAGRARLIRGVLVESGVLALAGGLAGLAFAVWASRVMAALDAGLGIPLLDQTRVDGTVVAFTAMVSLAVALLFGSLPALQSSTIRDLAARVRESGTTSTGDRQRQRLRAALIVAETSLAVVLLVGAGLLLRSFWQMASVDLGFDPRAVQTFNVSLPNTAYDTPTRRAAFIETLTSRAAGLPGVAHAGATFGLPLTNFRYTISMSTLDGRQLDNDEQMARSMQIRVVTPGFFRAMGMTVVRGRGFEASDRLGSMPVVLINEVAASRLWPAADPLGHHFEMGTRLGQGGPRAGGTVIGVVGNVREFGPVGPLPPTVYLAHAQFPSGFASLAVRSAGPRPPSIEALRSIVSEIDPNVPIFNVRTMDERVANATAQPRVYLLLLGLFAAVAVLLAALGIYGVLAHAVAQRTREIGIRLALGARRGGVVAMVVRQAAALALAGLLTGLALALAMSRVMTGLLFQVEPTDAATYAAVAAGLFTVALIASYLPARRAARVDPVRALKYE
jgi:predicted permease